MRIISTALPAQPSEVVNGRPAVLMALDTLVGDKSLIVGLTVGRLGGPKLSDVQVSPVGQAIIDRCGAHLQRNYANGTVLVAGVAQAASAKRRVRHVLEHAPAQAFVLLVCADDKVYDAAFPALGLDMQSLQQRFQ